MVVLLKRIEKIVRGPILRSSNDVRKNMTFGGRAIAAWRAIIAAGGKIQIQRKDPVIHKMCQRSSISSSVQYSTTIQYK